MYNKTLFLIAQRRLRELKTKISTQSKKNFMRERDVRFLDARIGLLIQNRMALDEVSFLLLFFSHVKKKGELTCDYFSNTK